jgi:hypothetical protein
MMMEEGRVVMMRMMEEGRVVMMRMMEEGRVVMMRMMIMLCCLCFQKQHLIEILRAQRILQGCIQQGIDEVAAWFIGQHHPRLQHPAGAQLV